MPSTIKHKRSSIPGAAPSTVSIEQSELAINLADGKLYTKNSNNEIINLGVASISGTVITPATGIFTKIIIGSNGATPESPTSSLYVQGNIHASGNGFFGTYNNNQYVQLGGFSGGDVGLVDYEDSPIAVKQADGIYNYHTITVDSSNNNNVGISRTDPSAKLDVNGDILSEEINIVSAVSGATLFNIEGTNGNLFSVVDSVSGSLMSVNDITGLPAFEVFSDHSVVAGRFNNNDFVVSSGGNVGIGTAAPSGKLHIVGNQYNNGNIYLHNTNAATPYTYNQIRTDASDNFIIQGGDNIFTLSGQGGSIDMRAFSTNITIGNSYNAGTTNQFIRFMPANTEAMRITNAGKVGIGTTTPEYKLQVNGSFGATTKSFRIDHPSRPNYTLEYGSLESPYHGVRLTGRGVVIKGSGVVSLPDYLKDLIHDDENINIQITNIKHGKTIYVDEIDLNNDQFTVRVDRAKTLGNLEFFWTLTGVRKDVEDLVVEREK